MDESERTTGVRTPQPISAVAAETVRLRRRELDLTQDELADLAGCSPRFIRELEAGKTTVRLDKLDAVLIALGLQLVVQRRTTS